MLFPVPGLYCYPGLGDGGVGAEDGEICFSQNVISRHDDLTGWPGIDFVIWVEPTRKQIILKLDEHLVGVTSGYGHISRCLEGQRIGYPQRNGIVM